MRRSLKDANAREMKELNRKILFAFLGIVFTIFLSLALILVKNKIFESKANDKTIVVYNWGEFMDTDVNTEFFERTGIRVNYKTFQSNEELFAKISAGNFNADVMIVSDYMISKLSKLGLLQKINYENIPNYSYISDGFKNLNFDSKNEFSVPYLWGMCGIVYNKKFVSPDDLDAGWNIFWNPKFLGKMLMFDNARDAFAVALLRLGEDINTENFDLLKRVAEELKVQKKFITSYVMDQIFEKMASEEAWLAPYYAGDAAVTSKINPNVDFIIPSAGTNFFVDSICIPKNSTKAEYAESYINFLCEPQIGKKNIQKTNYSSPNSIVVDSLPQEIKNNKNFYPDYGTLKNSKSFISLSRETEILIDQLWTEIKVNKKSSPWWMLLILLFFVFIYAIVIR